MGYKSIVILNDFDKIGLKKTLEKIPVDENGDRAIYTGFDIVTEKNVDDFMEIAEKIYKRGK